MEEHIDIDFPGDAEGTYETHVIPAIAHWREALAKENRSQELVLAYQLVCVEQLCCDASTWGHELPVMRRDLNSLSNKVFIFDPPWGAIRTTFSQLKADDKRSPQLRSWGHDKVLDDKNVPPSRPFLKFGDAAFVEIDDSMDYSPDPRPNEGIEYEYGRKG